MWNQLEWIPAKRIASQLRVEVKLVAASTESVCVVHPSNVYGSNKCYSYSTKSQSHHRSGFTVCTENEILCPSNTSIQKLAMLRKKRKKMAETSRRSPERTDTQYMSHVQNRELSYIKSYRDRSLDILNISKKHFLNVRTGRPSQYIWLQYQGKYEHTSFL